MTLRAFLKMSAAAAAGLWLGGQAMAADLNALVWCDHSDPNLLKPFEDANGIKVNVKEFEGTGAGFAIVAGKLGLPTINVEKYVGVAKANNKGSSIISMWSGPFSSVEYSASGGWFGGSAQYFNSPDGNIHGGALSVNVGLSLPKPPGASNAFEKVILKLAGLGASFTCYTPWDDYTKKFESLDGTGYYGSSKCGEAGSGKYTQFSSYMTMYAQMVVYGIMEVPALVATLIETALK